jgi:NAD+ synthase (glutamine-hydrolysing)
MNGRIVAQGSQFSLQDVEVVTATLDLEDVRSHRIASRSRSMQAASGDRYRRIEVETALSSGKAEDLLNLFPTPVTETRIHSPEEEIACVRLSGDNETDVRGRLGPACWMWDYLRRSRTSGYFVPLSGGIDSCATAVITFSMCRLVVEAARNGSQSSSLGRTS